MRWLVAAVWSITSKAEWHKAWAHVTWRQKPWLLASALSDPSPASYNSVGKRVSSHVNRVCWHVVLVFALLPPKSTQSPRSPKDPTIWGGSPAATVPSCWGSCARIWRRAALLSRARCPEYLGPHQSRLVAIEFSMRLSRSLLLHESRVAKSHTFGCHLASHLSCLGRSIPRHSIASTSQLLVVRSSSAATAEDRLHGHSGWPSLQATIPRRSCNLFHEGPGARSRQAPNDQHCASLRRAPVCCAIEVFRWPAETTKYNHGVSALLRRPMQVYYACMIEQRRIGFSHDYTQKSGRNS